MNKKKIIVELSSSWTLDHSAGGLPANRLAEKLKTVLPNGSEVIVEEFTYVVIVVDADAISEEAVVAQTVEQFCAIYGSESKDALKISVAATETAKEEPKKFDETLTPSDGARESLFGDPSAPAKKETKAAVREEIDGLIGAEDLKAFASEIEEVAPFIIKNKTYDVFTNQSYIFSINDGYGLSTYASLLAKLIAQAKLKNISMTVPAVEVKLGVPDEKDPFSVNYPYGAFAPLLQLINERKACDCVLCIDISEWMSSMESGNFRKLLKLLNKVMDHYVFVFRIPYVEPDVLERVQQALNDLMFVRALTFPPLSREELQLAAEKDIKRYGFETDESAWEFFHARVAEEKRDGKFYGFNTVKKIVRELIYKKHLSSAKSGEENACISREDMSSLSTHREMEGLSGFEQLSKLVGGEAIRKQVEEILLQIEFARSDKSGAMKSPCIHMRFVGNPGTGKTTVARIVGGILKEKDVLRIGGFYEYAGRDFCGRYIGETAPKTASICRDAYGSVLFIDEAYTLYRGNTDGKDYGREALDTLIAEMENHRDDFVVIMAGYTDEMEELMKGNAGLVGRMPYVIEFPNFTREQLSDIFVSMLENCKYSEDLVDAVKSYFLGLSDTIVNSKEFSNARFVRNLYERTWAKALRRCQLEKNPDVVLCAQDFEQASAEKGFKSIMEKKTARLGFYE